MFCRTVSDENSAPCWNRIPHRPAALLVARSWLPIGAPITSISPSCRAMSPMMVRISTDLPPPEAHAPHYGTWTELGYHALASPDEVLRVLGEVNHYATVTLGSLISAEHIPTSGWNDPEYWPVFDSVNRDSYSAGEHNMDDYVAVVQPPAKTA